jgi:hypothetical protein
MNPHVKSVRVLDDYRDKGFLASGRTRRYACWPAMNCKLYFEFANEFATKRNI